MVNIFTPRVEFNFGGLVSSQQLHKPQSNLKSSVKLAPIDVNQIDFTKLSPGATKEISSLMCKLCGSTYSDTVPR